MTDFETNLRAQIAKDPNQKRWRRVKRILAMKPSLRRKARLTLMEHRVSSRFGLQEVGGIIDWSKIDWNKVFEEIAKIILALLPLLLAL